MSTERRLTIVRLSRVVYAGLLIFYPANLRREFGAEMADVFEDAVHDAIVERRPAGVTSLWRSAHDLQHFILRGGLTGPDLELAAWTADAAQI